MQYIFHKAASGNFGDDLNPWLWPQLLGGMNQNSEEYFLGIGSILFNENKKIQEIRDKKKIVFGTGVRPSSNYQNLEIDSTWDIRFLRGPLSAMSLGNQYSFITDAAYAVRHLENAQDYLKVEKKYEISLMPYFKSVGHFDWEHICRELGYHYISPLSERGVEFTLKEIAASKYLITEAMHGAILADALRVPWHRYILSTFHYESQRVSEFKWMDWMFSMELGYVKSTFIDFYHKGLINKVLWKLTNGDFKSEIFQKAIVKNAILNNLNKPLEYNLSNDKRIAETDEQIQSEIRRL